MNKLTKKTKKVLEIHLAIVMITGDRKTRTSIHIKTVHEQNMIMYLQDLFEKDCNRILKFVEYCNFTIMQFNRFSF